MPVNVLSVASLVQEARQGNNDLKTASLYKTKAEYAIDASQYGYLPDFGIISGDAYQEGNALYPENNAFIGVSFKWNIQDIFANTYVQRQRISMKKQAEENLADLQEQVNTDIEKTRRKLTQSTKLITVANKVLAFRREDLKIQTDRRHAGLNLEADLFAAQLNYRTALTDLKILTGNF